MTARDAILARIRAATAEVPEDEPPAWDHERDRDPASAYVRARDEPDSVRIDRFAARVREHGGRIAQVDDRAGGIAGALADACARLRLAAAVVPADLSEDWVPAEVARVVDRPPLSHADLAAAECAITAAALAIADTGTIVFDAGPAQGRRALSLVPDVHLCVLRASQVVGTVPEAVARLAPTAASRRPLTLVSGPSATSDIAFERVVGVHGPRTLEVVLVRDLAPVPPP